MKSIMFILILLCVIAKGRSLKFNITEHPEDVTATVGSMVTFTCGVNLIKLNCNHQSRLPIVNWKVGLEENRTLQKNTTSICDNKTVVSTLELFASHDMNSTPVQCNAHKQYSHTELLLFSKFAVLTVMTPGQKGVEDSGDLPTSSNGYHSTTAINHAPNWQQ